MAAGNNGDGRCELTESDLIWNRACSGGGLSPMPGDRALASLLKVHGLAMNGGVLHAVECLKPSEISDAKSGYSFFGLDSIADLLVHARGILEAGDDLEYHESQLDK